MFSNLRMSNYDDGDCKTITRSLSLPPTWKLQAFFHFKMLNFNAPLWKFQCIQNCEKLLIFFSATLCNVFIFLFYFSIVDFNFNKVEPRYFISIVLCISKFYFILKFPFSCYCLHIFHFIYVVNFLAFFISLYKFFCRKNFSFTNWHAIAKINLKFHNFIVIHST